LLNGGKSEAKILAADTLTISLQPSMALYEAYFDESHNDEGNPLILVVGGYVYRDRDVAAMDAEWK